VESDVNSTLSELERKLKELERELESVGRGGELDAEPAQAGWVPQAPPPSPPPPSPPPPPGATPLTAVWHGGATPPPPPAPLGGQPVRVAPPPAGPVFVPQGAPPAPAPAPAPGLHEQLDELIAFRDRLVKTTDDLVAELSRVLTELGVDAPAPPPPPDPADTPLSGDVVVTAAPFADLATLAAFEQALRAVPGVTDVYVRSLDQGHAEVDVRLSGWIPLGAALRTTFRTPFRVTSAGDGHLTIAL
jgi:hypothetical protein